MKAVFLLTVVITSFSSLIANGENFEATLNALKEESLVLKITEHGVVGDGETINTVGLQKAIDYCHEKGGGTLWFPAGKYVTGTIRLKSNITLSFDHEAYLLGSLKMEASGEARVFLLAGQSNMSGAGLFDQLKKSEQKAPEGVKIWNKNQWQDVGPGVSANEGRLGAGAGIRAGDAKGLSG